MTREEAIEILQNIAWSVGSVEREQIQTALDMAIEALSADRPTEDYSDLPDIPRAYYEKIVGNMAHEINMLKEQLESADAVPIHEDGTLEVKVPNAQKVGRVLVMDTDSHIGGGLFYPDDAVQGDGCDHCVYKWGMKGGDDE